MKKLVQSHRSSVCQLQMATLATDAEPPETASLDLSALEANALLSISSLSLDLVKAALALMLFAPQASIATEVPAFPLPSKKNSQEKANPASEAVSVLQV